MSIRATWKTSLLAGLVFGFLVALIGETESSLAILGLMVAFFSLGYFLVLGVPQFQDLLAKRRKRKDGIPDSVPLDGEFRQFFLHAFGRLLLWFVATATTGLITSHVPV